MSYTENGSNDNSRTSQLIRTLIPNGELDSNKEYIDVRKYYIALYKYKRGKKYNFDIFTIEHNAEVGSYLKSVDDKNVGVLNPNLKIGTIKGKVNYEVNCFILSANKFDSIRLLMYNNGLIKAYVPGMATKEEINEVLFKISSLHQSGVNYLFDDLSEVNRRRHRG